jgi:hypothetical protein
MLGVVPCFADGFRLVGGSPNIGLGFADPICMRLDEAVAAIEVPLFHIGPEPAALPVSLLAETTPPLDAGILSGALVADASFRNFPALDAGIEPASILPPPPEPGPPHPRFEAFGLVKDNPESSSALIMLGVGSLLLGLSISLGYRGCGTSPYSFEEGNAPQTADAGPAVALVLATPPHRAPAAELHSQPCDSPPSPSSASLPARSRISKPPKSGTYIWRPGEPSRLAASGSGRTGR